jgi:hypothetical protein
LPHPFAFDACIELARQDDAATTSVWESTAVPAIKDAFDHLTHGLGESLYSLGQAVEGALTLDFKKVGEGAQGMVEGALTTVRGAIDLTPPALAANSLLDGAVDKALGMATGFAGTSFQAVQDPIASGLDDAKSGLGDTVEGLQRGDVLAAVGGVANVGEAAAGAYAAATPTGVATDVIGSVVQN